MKQLVVNAHQLGLMKKGEFISYMTFVFDVCASVETTPGYLSQPLSLHSVIDTSIFNSVRFLSVTMMLFFQEVFFEGCELYNPNGTVRSDERRCLAQTGFQFMPGIPKKGMDKKLKLAVCLDQQPDSVV
jgi:hypothetical protein